MFLRTTRVPGLFDLYKSVKRDRRGSDCLSEDKRRRWNRSKTRGVLAGLVPAISIRMAQVPDYRDGRDIRAFTPVFDGLLPGHDQVELPRVLPLSPPMCSGGLRFPHGRKRQRWPLVGGGRRCCRRSLSLLRRG
jgi:hypothetical protein